MNVLVNAGNLSPLYMQHFGPILILCSEDDQLATYSVVQNFGQHLLELGGDVNLIKWHSSPHVGMFSVFCLSYLTAVLTRNCFDPYSIWVLTILIIVTLLLKFLAIFFNSIASPTNSLFTSANIPLGNKCKY